MRFTLPTVLLMVTLTAAAPTSISDRFKEWRDKHTDYLPSKPDDAKAEDAKTEDKGPLTLLNLSPTIAPDIDLGNNCIGIAVCNPVTVDSDDDDEGEKKDEKEKEKEEYKDYKYKVKEHKKEQKERQ